MSSIHHPSSSQYKPPPHMAGRTPYATNREQCRDFLNGYCPRWRFCPWYHDFELLRNRPSTAYDSSGKVIPLNYCRDFLNHTCPRERCPLYHDAARKQRLQNVSSSESETSTEGPPQTERRPVPQSPQSVAPSMDLTLTASHQLSPLNPSPYSPPNQYNQNQDMERGMVVTSTPDEQPGVPPIGQVPPINDGTLVEGGREARLKQPQISGNFCYEFYATGSCHKRRCNLPHLEPPPESQFALSRTSLQLLGVGAPIPELLAPQPIVARNVEPRDMVIMSTSGGASHPPQAIANKEPAAPSMDQASPNKVGALAEEGREGKPRRPLLCYEFYVTGRCRIGMTCTFPHLRPPIQVVPSAGSPKLPSVPGPSTPQPVPQHAAEPSPAIVETPLARPYSFAPKKSPEPPAAAAEHTRTLLDLLNSHPQAQTTPQPAHSSSHQSLHLFPILPSDSPSNERNQNGDTEREMVVASASEAAPHSPNDIANKEPAVVSIGQVPPIKDGTLTEQSRDAKPKRPTILGGYCYQFYDTGRCRNKFCHFRHLRTLPESQTAPSQIALKLEPIPPGLKAQVGAITSMKLPELSAEEIRSPLTPPNPHAQVSQIAHLSSHQSSDPPSVSDQHKDMERGIAIASTSVAMPDPPHVVASTEAAAPLEGRASSTKDGTVAGEGRETNPRRPWVPSLCHLFRDTGRCNRRVCHYRHGPQSSDPHLALSPISAKLPSDSARVPESTIKRNVEPNPPGLKARVVSPTAKEPHEPSAEDKRTVPIPSNPHAHTQPTSQTTHPRDQQVHEKTVLASTQVRFGPGAAVQTITTGFESRNIFINGLPLTILPSRLIAILEAFGSPEILSITERPDKKSQSARVSFQDSVQASRAAASLHGTKLDSHRLEASLERRTSSQTGQITRTTIQLWWDPPSRCARAIFDSRETARLRARDLHRSSFRGRRIYTSLDKHSADQLISRSVFIRGLPSDVDLPTLKRFFMAVHVTSWEHDTDSEDTFTHLRTLLDKFGEVEDFYRLPMDPTKVEVRFRLEEQAQRAVASLLKFKPHFLSGRELRARALEQVYYKVPYRQYIAQSQDFHAARQLKDGDIMMKTKVQEDLGYVGISILGHSTDRLSQFKARVELLTAGEKMLHAGMAVWDGSFLTARGRAFLDRVFDETQAFIYPDGRKRCLVIYGAPTRKLQAKLMVQMELRRIEGQCHTIPLGKASVRYFCVRGLRRLRKELGVDNVKLDVSIPCVTIRGGDSAMKQLRLTIRASLADVSLDKGPTSSACPVCLGYVVDPSLLPCKHAYCTPCLRHLVKDSKTFPLTCLQEGCNCPIPIPNIRTLLSHTEFDELLDTAFLNFIQAHPNEFHYCPTADCPQIYRSAESADPPPLQCPSCITRICSYCHLGAHDGFSCQSYQNSAARREDERLFEEWKKSNDVKPCPSCQTDLQKDYGCNHLTCTRCKTHICWACMATFTSDGGVSVYEHMQEVHGGIGVPVAFAFDD